MWFIVPDEQRGNRPKSARPEGVAPGSSPGGQVIQPPGLYQPCPGDMAACPTGASLVRATSPACEMLLAGELPGAITVDQYHVITL